MTSLAFVTLAAIAIVFALLSLIILAGIALWRQGRTIKEVDRELRKYEKSALLRWQ